MTWMPLTNSLQIALTRQILMLVSDQYLGACDAHRWSDILFFQCRYPHTAAPTYPLPTPPLFRRTRPRVASEATTDGAAWERRATCAGSKKARQRNEDFGSFVRSLLIDMIYDIYEHYKLVNSEHRFGYEISEIISTSKWLVALGAWKLQKVHQCDRDNPADER